MMRNGDDAEQSDETIWEGSTTLSALDTKDAKVHVTLRLEPNMYRAIVAEKKAANDRTITATIERILERGLKNRDAGHDAETFRLVLRTLVEHTAAQDKVLEMMSGLVKPRSARDRDLIAKLHLPRWPDSVQQWLVAENVSFMAFDQPKTKG